MSTEEVDRHAVCEALREWISANDLGGTDFKIYEDGRGARGDEDTPERIWIYYEGSVFWSVMECYHPDWVKLETEFEDIIRKNDWWYERTDNCNLYLYPEGFYDKFMPKPD